MSPASALSYLLKPNAVLSYPPSSVIEQAFKSGNVTPDNLARKVLLPLSEVEMWLNHLGMVSNNRKRGAAKAAATKRSKLSGRKNDVVYVVSCMRKKQMKLKNGLRATCVLNSFTGAV